jgi:hypothetical protein
MDELACRSAKKQTAIYWPELVDQRLDALNQLAERAGEQTSRAQTLAALVCAAPADGEGLGVMIRNYRRLTVRQLQAEPTEPTGSARRPGPRRRA